LCWLGYGSKGKVGSVQFRFISVCCVHLRQ